MRAEAVAVALAVLVGTLAGCSGPDSSAEVVVQSQPQDAAEAGTQVIENATIPAATPPKDGSRGHIAGVVVDEAIRPIAGAKVRLPGLDLTRTSDRDGSFSFVDLVPASYLLTVAKPGYLAAQALLEVNEGEFTRAKVVLTAIPPPTPYHVVQKFDGFAEATDVAGVGYLLIGEGLTCSHCTFDLTLDRTDVLEDAVFEATMDPDGSGGNSFEDYVTSPDNYTQYDYAQRGNPMRFELKGPDLGGGERFDLAVTPQSFPAPESNKAFEVFVTAFYYQAAPAGWSFVAGDT